MLVSDAIVKYENASIKSCSLSDWQYSCAYLLRCTWGFPPPFVMSLHFIPNAPEVGFLGCNFCSTFTLFPRQTQFFLWKLQRVFQANSKSVSCMCQIWTEGLPSASQPKWFYIPQLTWCEPAVTGVRMMLTSTCGMNFFIFCFLEHNESIPTSLVHVVTRVPYGVFNNSFFRSESAYLVKIQKAVLHFSALPLLLLIHQFQGGKHGKYNPRLMESAFCAQEFSLCLLVFFWVLSAGVSFIVFRDLDHQGFLSLRLVQILLLDRNLLFSLAFYGFHSVCWYANFSSDFLNRTGAIFCSSAQVPRFCWCSCCCLINVPCQ